MVHKRRLLRLVQPRIQLKLMLAFGSLTATGLLLQFLLFTLVLTRAAEGLPSDGLLLLDQVKGLLLTILIGTFVLLLPLIGVVGILATHHWAGPLFRFERFLEALLRGERPADIRLRAGDELTGFCALLNQATAPLRATQPQASVPTPAPESTATAA